MPRFEFSLYAIRIEIRTTVRVVRRWSMKETAPNFAFNTAVLTHAARQG